MVITWPSQRAAGNVPHGVQTVGLQLFGVTAAYPPEIRERTVVPQVAAVAHLVQLRDTHTICIRLDVFGPNIHGDLAEVEIRADARRGGDAGRLQYILNDLHRQLAGAEFVGVQVVGNVHQHFVYRIVVNVTGGNVFEIDIVDPGTPLHVVRHPGRSHDVVHRQTGVGFQRGIIGGGTGEPPARRGQLPLGVDLPDPLYHLEQPGPSGDAPGFQGGGDGQTDSLFRSAQVRHHKVGGQGIEAALDTFDGCVEAFCINGQIRPLLHGAAPLPEIHLDFIIPSYAGTTQI